MKTTQKGCIKIVNTISGLHKKKEMDNSNMWNSLNCELLKVINEVKSHKKTISNLRHFYTLIFVTVRAEK